MHSYGTILETTQGNSSSWCLQLLKTSPESHQSVPAAQTSSSTGHQLLSHFTKSKGTTRRLSEAPQPPLSSQVVPASLHLTFWYPLFPRTPPHQPGHLGPLSCPPIRSSSAPQFAHLQLHCRSTKHLRTPHCFLPVPLGTEVPPPSAPPKPTPGWKKPPATHLLFNWATKPDGR